MSLKAFLKENVEIIDNVEYVVSERMKDENGKPVPWKLRTLSTKETKLWRNDFTKVSIGKKGARTETFDGEEYIKKCAVESITYPDLNDKELQDSYGVMSADDLLIEMLLPGEYTKLIEKMNEINGFDTSFEDKVEEAKN
ncbi:MAG: phage portal protein [Bacteroidota bacterium]|nr:phage portal protein [Bacteroidota bacterium]